MIELKKRHLEKALQDYGAEVAERYKAALLAEGKRATGGLYNSVQPVFSQTDAEYIVSIQMAFYGDYIERGTRLQGPYKNQGLPPGKPMRSAILEWIRVKNIQPRFTMKNGKLPTPKTLAYFIANKIYEKGTRPYWLLRDSLDTPEEIRERIVDALRLDLQDWLDDTLTSLGF
jgi:hypothetical protein